MTTLAAKDVQRSALPLISIAGLRSPDVQARAAVARELRAACLDKGFFYVCDHGVPDEVLASVLAEARRFFALPLEAKLAIRSSPPTAKRGSRATGSARRTSGRPACRAGVRRSNRISARCTS